MAQVCASPALMAVPPLRPTTSLGEVELFDVPVPARPLAPDPQHFPLPEVVRAQVWDVAAEICAPKERPPPTVTGA